MHCKFIFSSERWLHSNDVKEEEQQPELVSKESVRFYVCSSSLFIYKPVFVHILHSFFHILRPIAKLSFLF